jgi:hypothetical protein
MPIGSGIVCAILQAIHLMCTFLLLRHWIVNGGECALVELERSLRGAATRKTLENSDTFMYSLLMPLFMFMTRGKDEKDEQKKRQQDLLNKFVYAFTIFQLFPSGYLLYTYFRAGIYTEDVPRLAGITLSNAKSDYYDPVMRYVDEFGWLKGLHLYFDKKARARELMESFEWTPAQLAKKLLEGTGKEAGQAAKKSLPKFMREL